MIVQSFERFFFFERGGGRRRLFFLISQSLFFFVNIDFCFVFQHPLFRTVHLDLLVLARSNGSGWPADKRSTGTDAAEFRFKKSNQSD